MASSCCARVGTGWNAADISSWCCSNWTLLRSTRGVHKGFIKRNGGYTSWKSCRKLFKMSDYLSLFLINQRKQLCPQMEKLDGDQVVWLQLGFSIWRQLWTQKFVTSVTRGDCTCGVCRRSKIIAYVLLSTYMWRADINGKTEQSWLAR